MWAGRGNEAFNADPVVDLAGKTGKLSIHCGGITFLNLKSDTTLNTRSCYSVSTARITRNVNCRRKYASHADAG
jgi:hypothetical protein